MRKTVLALFVFAFAAVPLLAQPVFELNPNAGKFMAKGFAKPGGGGGSNLIYHTGGTVIQSAHVVEIFWGALSDFPAGYVTELQAYRDHYGSTNQYNVITQYYDSFNGNIVNATLGGGTPDWQDTLNALPANGNVTDALVQCEVKAYLAGVGSTVTCSDGSIKQGSGLAGSTPDYSAVYEVFLPASHNGTSVYSSSGSSDSCGGPNLSYCAYHSHYGSGSTAVKYSIEPFASCSGCQTDSTWTATQNQEHFISHETREAVTDELGNAWFDRRGYEADDKCAWSPTPFRVATGTYNFGYQYEWSNAAATCVQATTNGGTVVASPN